MAENYNDDAMPPVVDDAVAADPTMPTEVPAAPHAPAPEAAPARQVVSVPRRWLVVGGSVVLAVVLLGGAFAVGVAAGHRSYRPDGRGDYRMMAPQPGMPGYGQDNGAGKGYEQDRGGSRNGARGQGHPRGGGQLNQDGSTSESTTQTQ